MPLFVFIFLFSSAWAQRPCPRGKLVCKISSPVTMEGAFHAATSPIDHFNENGGTYYAYATGRTCRQAQLAGEAKLLEKYPYLGCDGQVKCGVNGGVYTGGKYCDGKTKDGRYFVWARCQNLFHGEILPKPSSTSGGGIILLKTLQRWDTKGRRSVRQ